jgi:hypothetical protein
MKLKELVAVLLFSLLGLSSFAQPQTSRFSFEINSGPSIANKDLGGADLNIGGGFEGIFHYRIMPHVSTHLGWGWNKFSANQSFAGPDIDFEETGYIFGLQFKHPFKSNSLSWFVRASGLYNHIEIENNDGDIIEDTGHGLGFQFAGGLDIPLNNKWSFTPSLKLNSLSRDLDTGSTTRNLDLNYNSLRLGFSVKL